MGEGYKKHTNIYLILHNPLTINHFKCMLLLTTDLDKIHNMSNTNQNPIWLAHDEFKTARLNVYYYQYQISRLKLLKLIFDIVAALSTSSIVAGLWFWQTSIGNVAWKAIGALAAVMVVIVPIFNISNRIKQKSEIYSGWCLIDDGFKKLEILIKEQNQYNDEMKNRFHQLLDMESDIKQKEEPEKVNKKIQRKCYEQVNIELTAESFFVPEEKQMSQEKEATKPPPEKTPEKREVPTIKTKEATTPKRIEPPEPWPRPKK